jgi:hypothetical protein
MSDEGSTPAREPGSGLVVTPFVGALLALRFALEVLLLAAYAVIGTGLVAGWLGWLLAAVLVLAVALVWGTWLSPKRRIDSARGVRITVELALFALAGLGLALVGHAVWGAVLVVVEVVAVALLRRPGEHVEGHLPG